MPKKYTNTVVFVGREFDVSLFDEKELTQPFGSIDKNSVRAGPIGDFTYAHGHYNLLVTPNRIDIRHSGEAILPPALLAAAEIVVGQLQPVRGLVSAVGINCDAVFSYQEIRKTGKEFCQALSEDKVFQHLYKDHPNAATSSVSTVFSSRDNLIKHTVRIEPEQKSNQEDLLVAFNGHQVVTVRDDIKVKLNAIDEVKDHVTRLHRQIVSLGK